MSLNQIFLFPVFTILICNAVKSVTVTGTPQRLFQLCNPLIFFESGQDKVIADNQRTFHQHTVRRQKRQLLIFAHFEQLFRQPQFPIRNAARIEEALQRQFAIICSSEISSVELSFASISNYPLSYTASSYNLFSAPLTHTAP